MKGLAQSGPALARPVDVVQRDPDEALLPVDIGAADDNHGELVHTQPPLEARRLAEPHGGVAAQRELAIGLALHDIVKHGRRARPRDGRTVLQQRRSVRLLDTLPAPQ